MDASAFEKVELPHEGGMRWVTEARLSADGEEAWARAEFGKGRAGHAFLREGRLQEGALVELMAQGAAAGAMLRAGRHGRRVKRGMLVGIREFEVMMPVEVGGGEVLEIRSRQEKKFGALTQVMLEVWRAGAMVARGRMTFHLEIE